LLSLNGNRETHHPSIKARGLGEPSVATEISQDRNTDETVAGANAGSIGRTGRKSNSAAGSEAQRDIGIGVIWTQRCPQPPDSVML
jgi:hypothetical protein